MYVAVYRWRVASQDDEQFRQAWKEITLYARNNCGSLGSALLKHSDGSWVAIAKWPNKEAMNKCWENMPQNKLSISEKMHATIVEKFETLELEMDTDLWVHS